MRVYFGVIILLITSAHIFNLGAQTTSELMRKSSEVKISPNISLEYEAEAGINPVNYPYFAINVYMHNMDYFNNVFISNHPNQSYYLNKNYVGKLKFITAKVVISSPDYNLEYPLFALRKENNSFSLNVASKLAILGMKPIKLNTTNYPTVSIEEMGEMKVISDATKFIYQSLQMALNDPSKFANPANGLLDLVKDGMNALSAVVANDTRGFSGKSTVSFIDFDDNNIYRYKYYGHIMLPKREGISANDRFEVRFDTTDSGKVIEAYMTSQGSFDKYIKHPYFLVEIGYTNYLNLGDLLPSQIKGSTTFNALTIEALNNSKEYLENNGGLLSSDQKKCEQELLRFLYNYKTIEGATMDDATIENIILGYDSYYNQKVGIVRPEIITSTVYVDKFKTLIDSVALQSLTLNVPFKEDIDSIIPLFEKFKQLRYDNIENVKHIHNKIYFYTNTFPALENTEALFFVDTKVYRELLNRKSNIEGRVFDLFISDTLSRLSESIQENAYDKASIYFAKVTEYKNTFGKFEYCVNEIEKVRAKYLSNLPAKLDNAKANYEYMIEDLSLYSNQYSALRELIFKNKLTNATLTSKAKDSLAISTNQMDSVHFSKLILDYQDEVILMDSLLFKINKNLSQVKVKQKELELILFNTESNDEIISVISKVKSLYSNYMAFKKEMENDIDLIFENASANSRYSL